MHFLCRHKTSHPGRLELSCLIDKSPLYSSCLYTVGTPALLKIKIVLNPCPNFLWWIKRLSSLLHRHLFNIYCFEIPCPTKLNDSTNYKSKCLSTPIITMIVFIKFFYFLFLKFCLCIHFIFMHAILSYLSHTDTHTEPHTQPHTDIHTDTHTQLHTEPILIPTQNPILTPILTPHSCLSTSIIIMAVSIKFFFLLYF